jgi:hypothetical protein
MACLNPVGPTLPPRNLTPASGRQDHTTSPYAATSLVRVLLIAHGFKRTRPAIPSRAKRCRVHRIPPRVRDDGQRPSVGWDAKSSRCDLGGVETGIFFQTGLDTKLPDGQITTAARAPSCPGRGAASFTLLRSAGTHAYTGAVDPGSAAHRHSASKTRVNALMALRGIRGTTGASREVHQTYLTKECRKAVGWVEPAKPIISIKCN